MADDSGARMLNDLLALSHVPRWVIVPHLRPQSVSDHVYRTMVISIVMAERLGVKFSVSDLLFVLCHDADESRTGDIPAPAKDAIQDHLGSWPDLCPWLRERTGQCYNEFRKVFRLADLIEAMTYIEAWGTGDHARRVKSGILDKIRLACLDEWADEVDGIIEDIRTYAGR